MNICLHTVLAIEDIDGNRLFIKNRLLIVFPLRDMARITRGYNSRDAWHEKKLFYLECIGIFILFI